MVATWRLEWQGLMYEEGRRPALALVVAQLRLMHFDAKAGLGLLLNGHAGEEALLQLVRWGIVWVTGDSSRHPCHCWVAELAWLVRQDQELQGPLAGPHCPGQIAVRAGLCPWTCAQPEFQ